MFFILVPFLKRAPCIIIHLARNAEKGGGVLMSIILPNLNHSFVPVPVPVPFPDSGFRFRFRILDFPVFHTPLAEGLSFEWSQFSTAFSNFLQILFDKFKSSIVDSMCNLLIAVFRGKFTEAVDLGEKEKLEIPGGWVFKDPLERKFQRGRGV